MEPHSMAILTGGAMRVIDPRSHSAGIADDCVGFLDLVWHGAHDGGSGIHPGVNVRVPIADDTQTGNSNSTSALPTACVRS